MLGISEYDWTRWIFVGQELITGIYKKNPSWIAKNVNNDDVCDDDDYNDDDDDNGDDKHPTLQRTTNIVIWEILTNARLKNIQAPKM